MKNLMTSALVALVLAACSSAPISTSMLEQARSEYQMAQQNPMVAKHARQELQSASTALDLANAAATRRDTVETIDRLAYLARQKAASATEVARAKAAEDEATLTAQQRDQMRLQARTAEADQAKRSAEQARQEAQSAQSQAASAEAATRDAQSRAAALASQLADLQAKQTERGIVVTFGDVLFNVDQAVLTSQGMVTAQRLADVLTQNPDRHVLIEGFTDSTGTVSYNLTLSQRRAEAVRNALVQMGVQRDRIDTHGYGEAYPVAGNTTAGERQLNRRVEIVLSEAGSPTTLRR